MGQLAYDEPDKARLTANNYMLYAMQNSLSPYDYAMATTSSWGTSVFQVGCEDDYTNCPDMAKEAGCCDTNSRLEGWCCASCAVVNMKDECVSNLPALPPKDAEPNCKDNFTN